jgi:hypothetical protein
MLKHVFPKLFGQYKQGSLIVGKFLVSNSGATLTPVAGDSHPLLTAAGDTGQYIVTLRDGAQRITVVSVHADLMDEDDPTDARLVFVNGEDDINAGNGTIPLTVITNGTEAVAPAVADLPDTSILTIVLYVDR